jgi:hypothetical protein
MKKNKTIRKEKWCVHNKTITGIYERCLICNPIKPKKEKKCCDGQAVFGGENHSVECEKPLTPKQFTEWCYKNDSYIKKLLQKTREEVVEEIKDIVKKALKEANNWTDDTACIMNNIIIKKLKTKLK